MWDDAAQIVSQAAAAIDLTLTTPSVHSRNIIQPMESYVFHPWVISSDPTTGADSAKEAINP